MADLDESGITGTREERRLALVEIGPDAGYATVRSVLDALLRELGFPAEYTSVDHPAFVPGRAARFTTAEGIEGTLGELHPEVLTNFSLVYPAAMAELVLERIL